MVAISAIYKLLNYLLNVLPDSPIQQWISDFKDQEWIGYLNYFVPVSFMVNCTTVWVAALATYCVVKYAYAWIRRMIS